MPPDRDTCGAPSQALAGHLARALVLAIVVLSPRAALASTPPPDAAIHDAVDTDQFGTAIANVGDVNDDGEDDFVVGAPGSDANTNRFPRVVLFYGPLSASLTIDDADATIVGEALDDAFGSAVAAAGDVNHDGYDDFIVGAPGNDTNGTRAGRAYLFYGPVSGALSALDADAIISGQPSDELGASVAGVGDIDNDGFDDVVVGAWKAGFANQGQVLLYRGPLSGMLGTGDARTLIAGALLSEELGYALSSGDLNGDGLTDLVVGAPQPPLFQNGPGRVYVFFSPVPADTIRSSSAEVVVTGESVNDEFGISVAVGDLDGDGRDDLVAGARQVYTPGPGTAYVFHGPLVGPVYIIPTFIEGGTADVIVTGDPEPPASGFGEFLNIVGDVNGDGVRDLVASDVRTFDTGYVQAGRAYVFHFLPPGRSPATLIAKSIITGAEYDQLGTSIAPAGDWNGDGLADIMLGAPGTASQDVNTFVGVYVSEAPTPVGAPAGGSGLSLTSFPSPFQSASTIRYEIAKAQHAEIGIYDVRGARVRTLVSADLPAGTGDVSWDGRDDSGVAVSAGVYFVRLQAGTHTITHKLVRVR